MSVASRRGSAGCSKWFPPIAGHCVQDIAQTSFKRLSPAPPNITALWLAVSTVYSGESPRRRSHSLPLKPVGPSAQHQYHRCNTNGPLTYFLLGPVTAWCGSHAASSETARPGLQATRAAYIVDSMNRTVKRAVRTASSVSVAVAPAACSPQTDASASFFLPAEQFLVYCEMAVG